MISVVMLTYNRENVVGCAIESILKQTLSDFEYIIVNNGSTDRSGKIAESYASKDDRIRVIHSQKGNIGAGRNIGLNASQGEWIAFIDDDDWCEPDYLEFLYGLAVSSLSEVAICGATDKVYDEKRVMSAEEALIELMWRKKYNVAFPAKLFKASLFEGVRFSEDLRYDDIELMPRIIGGANRIAYHGLPKYTFERHGGNNSAWTTNHGLLDEATLDEYLSVYRVRTQWLCERFPDRTMAWRYFEWSFMISMVEKIIRLKLSACESQRATMTQKLFLNRKEFLECELILDFEKEWVDKYILKA